MDLFNCQAKSSWQEVPEADVMKKIYVSGMLRALAYDINMSLDNNVSSEKVVKMINKKLKEFDNNKYIKVVWD